MAPWLRHLAVVPSDCPATKRGGDGKGKIECLEGDGHHQDGETQEVTT